MKLDIILSGVGGQGILSIATIIGAAAIRNGLFLKQSEVHGMAQRGGDVQSHLRIADHPIFSDLIPQGKADLIISVEPLESLRYTTYLSPQGWLITNTKPYLNITNYPPLENVLAEIAQLPFHLTIDADQIATELGSPLAMNMVILGAAAEFMPLSFQDLEQAIHTIFQKKGENVVNLNLNALKKGNEIAKVQKNYLSK